MARNRKRASGSTNPAATTTGLDVPEDEQWRIIQESGVLNGFGGGKRPSEVRREQARFVEVDSEDERENEDEEAESDAVYTPEEQQEGDLADEIFESALLVIPLCFLYAMMDMLCRMQYAQHATVFEVFKRTISLAPVIAMLVFYTNKHKAKPLAQAIMFCAAVFAGIRLIWVVNHSGYQKVIRQSPPLSVIWVYMIIQLNLTPAVISLVFIYGLVKFLKLKIIWNN